MDIMNTPKKIYFSKYSGSNHNSDGVTLENAIINLLVNGGGSMTLTGGNIAKFWKDIATNRSVKTVMNLDGSIISSQAVTICTYNGNGAQLAASVTMYHQSFGGLFTLSYVISGNGVSDDATIIVKLT